VAVSPSSNRGGGRPGEGGFTLIEVMICTLILTTGMLGIAGLLGVTTQMHFGAREAARATRLAQEKIDDLMKLDLDVNPQVAVGGSLTANQASHFEIPLDGITVRWTVAAHASGNDALRVLTVRVENLRAQTYGRRTELSTIIRQW
jgi:prepilin-type N-terminal cleavage/methylation domain-containing protein